MNKTVWKIESSVKGGPKIELVTVVQANFTNVTVHSIMDGYEFKFNKNYFLQNRKLATKEDIDNYKFELN